MKAHKLQHESFDTSGTQVSPTTGEANRQRHALEKDCHREQNEYGFISAYYLFNYNEIYKNNFLCE